MPQPIKPFVSGQRVRLTNNFRGLIGQVYAGATPQRENREPFYYAFESDNGVKFTVGHSEIAEVEVKQPAQLAASVPVATLKRCEATEWRDYAVYADVEGAFVLDGVRVRIVSVYYVPDNLMPRWTVSYWGDAEDKRAVELIGAVPFHKEQAAVYGWK